MPNRIPNDFGATEPGISEAGTKGPGRHVSRQPVRPDIDVPADRALETAYLAALRELLGREPNGEMAAERKLTMEAVQKRLDAIKPR